MEFSLGTGRLSSRRLAPFGSVLASRIRRTVATRRYQPSTESGTPSEKNRFQFFRPFGLVRQIGSVEYSCQRRFRPKPGRGCERSASSGRMSCTNRRRWPLSRRRSRHIYSEQPKPRVTFVELANSELSIDYVYTIAYKLHAI
jgi:hypothetical protein